MAQELKCNRCDNDVEPAIKEFFDDANKGMQDMGRSHRFPILCGECLEEIYNIDSSVEVVH